ncbi:helix-turn-helix transcriptional regulator [Ruegeria arenilitoris]|uniref:helix-turn-helix transcriptional regulator n=1 Tax=Ruegeria arenilitoris TaxID=1173585 RepID=UPI00147D2B80|nr:helix-turn-helix transcriptional regulator [Ruegeria arenilitoris]
MSLIVCVFANVFLTIRKLNKILGDFCVKIVKYECIGQSNSNLQKPLNRLALVSKTFTSWCYMDRGMGRAGAWLPNTQHTRALISFIQWSQGGVVLDAALTEVVNAFGADCGTLSRVWLNKGGSRIAARADTRDQTISRPLFLSFTNDVIGPFASKPKKGVVFSLKDHGKPVNEFSAVVLDWISHRKLHDILFVCLDNQGCEIDFLELHFAKGLEPGWREAIETVAPEISEIYRNRRAGLITEAISRQSVTTIQRAVNDAPLMSLENPAGLTRAEWRVCVLISRGLSQQSIGSELEIGPATVRTHLKHIYGKTGMENFHMLARRLVSIEEREALHGRHNQARA